MSHESDPKRILVTGASGFVGQHLCQLLTSKCRPFRRVLRSRRMTAGEPVSSDAIFIDRIDGQTVWHEALQGIDCIIHLAARVHVMDETSENPLQLFREVNVHGTLKLAEAAAAAGVRRFIYMSSIKVNGEQTSQASPFQASDRPNPQDPYGVSKSEAEMGLKELSQRTGMELVIIRPPLIYGPGVRANFLRLLGTVDRGVPLPLAAVQNKRSLLFVGNLVDVIYRSIDHPGAANQTFLVSDAEDLSTPGLIRLIAAELHKPSRLFPIPPLLLFLTSAILRIRPQMQRLTGSLVVDPSHLKSAIGWNPKYSVAAGIRETAAWYRSLKK